MKSLSKYGLRDLKKAPDGQHSTFENDFKYQLLTEMHTSAESFLKQWLIPNSLLSHSLKKQYTTATRYKYRIIELFTHIYNAYVHM